MIQLKLIHGTRAGTEYLVRQLPLTMGRASTNALRLQEPGVWDHHLEIHLTRDNDFVLMIQGEALATVNDHPVQKSAVLANGDHIGLGSLQLLFSLSPTVQKSLGPREILTWVALGLFSLGQIVLIYWLPG